MRVGLLTDRINNALEKSNLINEHALNREPVPLTRKKGRNLAIGCSLTQTNLWPLLPAQCQYFILCSSLFFRSIKQYCLWEICQTHCLKLIHFHRFFLLIEWLEGQFPQSDKVLQYVL